MGEAMRLLCTARQMMQAAPGTNLSREHPADSPILVTSVPGHVGSIGSAVAASITGCWGIQPAQRVT
jgi:hypothetical protein